MEMDKLPEKWTAKDSNQAARSLVFGHQLRNDVMKKYTHHYAIPSLSDKEIYYGIPWMDEPQGSMNKLNTFIRTPTPSFATEIHNFVLIDDVCDHSSEHLKRLFEHLGCSNAIGYNCQKGSLCLDYSNPQDKAPLDAVVTALIDGILPCDFLPQLFQLSKANDFNGLINNSFEGHYKIDTFNTGSSVLCDPSYDLHIAYGRKFVANKIAQLTHVSLYTEYGIRKEMFVPEGCHCLDEPINFDIPRTKYPTCNWIKTKANTFEVLESKKENSNFISETIRDIKTKNTFQVFEGYCVLSKKSNNAFKKLHHSLQKKSIYYRRV